MIGTAIVLVALLLLIVFPMSSIEVLHDDTSGLAALFMLTLAGYYLFVALIGVLMDQRWAFARGWGDHPVGIGRWITCPIDQVPLT
ncbi:MAG: hypothetical protein IPJ76_09240 [Flavobacteriales bacterium]|nr:MAG: hypothetical protein IPJ76_09240 [Flavobacteriales bacterium]